MDSDSNCSLWIFIDPADLSSVTPVIILAETLLQRSLFQVPDEIPIAPGRPASLGLAAPPATGARRSRIYKTTSIRRWRVVSWAGLQPNGCVRVEMAGDPLYRCRYAALLLFHGRSPLPSHRLLVHAGLLRDSIVICIRHLRGVHANLAVWIRLRTVCRWRAGMAGRVHVVTAIGRACAVTGRSILASSH